MSQRTSHVTRCSGVWGRGGLGVCTVVIQECHVSRGVPRVMSPSRDRARSVRGVRVLCRATGFMLPHTDGYVYGEYYPDHIFLLMESPVRGPNRKHGTPVSGWQQQLMSQICVPGHVGGGWGRVGRRRWRCGRAALASTCAHSRPRRRSGARLVPYLRPSNAFSERTAVYAFSPPNAAVTCRGGAGRARRRPCHRALPPAAAGDFQIPWPWGLNPGLALWTTFCVAAWWWVIS